ncbi:hypothetical protein HNQ41_001562 [Texcoconibacillus texcoconensis]|uniref:Secreted protein n=2 Tax=Texcoconibacillus texcoconensis TaxID=1095777 RepID=A0A840QPS5_9BACI|nr:hypothetical protein [Texcoconibacillus texcoconensis]
MKLKYVVVAGVFLAGILISLSVLNDTNTTSEDVGTEDIKQLVDDYTEGNIPDEVASITSHELIATDSDDNETIYELPEDEFFVSIAPYVDQTHP